MLSVVTLKCRNFLQDQTYKNISQQIFFQYKDKTKKMHTNVSEYLILYYKHITPPTCLGHSCGHPQEGIIHRIYYKNFKNQRHRTEDGQRSGRNR